jgi:hypothetical protein
MTEEYISAAIENNSKKMTCFIITPIGDDNSSIRRHIDGLIDECIVPVLSKKYDVKVAHRITTPGSINKQVISLIYEADLVIANLTGLNANVMYELAFRHAIRKEVILIMEKGETRLPFDVTTERTIFYSNDFQGAIELKIRLGMALDEIERNHEKPIDNPIYTALEKVIEEESIIKNIKANENTNVDALKFIINKLEDIETKIILNKNTILIENHNLISENTRGSATYIIYIKIDELSKSDGDKLDKLINKLPSIIKFTSDLQVMSISLGGLKDEVYNSGGQKNKAYTSEIKLILATNDLKTNMKVINMVTDAMNSVLDELSINCHFQVSLPIL